MNKHDLELCAQLRQYTSDGAFNWLMVNFPSEDLYAAGKAIILISHRSWKRSEQIRLFSVYFHRSFPEDSRSIGAFLKISSLKLFTRMLKDFVDQHLGGDERKLSLASYYLQVFIARYADQAQKEELRRVVELVNSKLSELRALTVQAGL